MFCGTVRAGAIAFARRIRAIFVLWADPPGAWAAAPPEQDIGLRTCAAAAAAYEPTSCLARPQRRLRTEYEYRS